METNWGPHKTKRKKIKRERTEWMRATVLSESYLQRDLVKQELLSPMIVKTQWIWLRITKLTNRTRWFWTWYWNELNSNKNFHSIRRLPLLILTFVLGFRLPNLISFSFFLYIFHFFGLLLFEHFGVTVFWIWTFFLFTFRITFTKIETIQAQRRWRRKNLSVCPFEQLNTKQNIRVDSIGAKKNRFSIKLSCWCFFPRRIELWWFVEWNQSKAFNVQ